MPATVRPARLVRLVLAFVASFALTACDAVSGVVDPGPDPREAATVLAEALSAGDLTSVPLVGGDGDQAQRSLESVVAGLGDLTPEVEVAEVERDADGGEDSAPQTASAALSWSWPVTDGETWTYTTTAPLRLVEDTWRVAWSPAVVQSAVGEGGRLDLTAVRARRGPVLGAGGDPLVTQRPVTRVGIDKTQVRAARAPAAARDLARAAGVEAGPFAQRVRAGGPEEFVEAIVLRADEVPARLVAAARRIDGARLIADRVPLAPTREFAAPLLGSVGPVTAEMVEEEPERYRPGDEAGLSGLQARYDEQLRGTDGLVVTAVGPSGRERRLFRVPARAGAALRLTLAERLQRRAEAALADVGPASALVALRPSDGAVLAAANGPGAGGLNLATYGQFAPGSTFKVVSALALLRAGLDPGTVVPCPVSVVVDGKRFENYDGFPAASTGPIPLREAVATSCNTAFIGQRGKVRGGAPAAAAASLGLGVDRDVGFPAYFGQVEPPATPTEAAATLIGQGRVLASPLAMAAVIGSVQEGATVVPRLVRGSLAPSVDPPEARGPTAREARALRGMLRGVVTQGSGVLLGDLPGPAVIAKTGTAEFEDGGALRTHAWMVAAQGDLAVAVFVERGESGSRTAGPVLERFLRAAR